MVIFNYLTLIEIILLITISFILTKLIQVFANKIGFVSKPNPIVETHKSPVAYGGGLAIGLSIIFFLLLQSPDLSNAQKLILIIIPILLIGLLDDVLKFSPLIKLTLQTISALPFLMYIITPIQIIPLILIFILIFQNAWNLVDIMDGLVSGISVVVFLSIGIILLTDKNLEFYSMLSIAIVFSTFGFRFLNKFPAKIFLGETGTLLLGSLFAFIIINVYLVNKLTALFLLLLGAVPLFELFFLIVIRTQKGIPFYKGSPDHFALRLQNTGLSVKSINKKVILFCSIHSAIIIFSAIFIKSIIVFIFCLVASIVIAAIAFLYFKSLTVKKITNL